MTRILTLNSEPEILGLLDMILTRAGYEHIGTTDTQQALAVLRNEAVDLFIRDALCPEMNGGTARALGDIPMLILTALSFNTLPESYRHKLATLYPTQYLTMPFSPHKLLTLIQSLLRGPASSES